NASTPRARWSAPAATPTATARWTCATSDVARALAVLPPHTSASDRRAASVEEVWREGLQRLVGHHGHGVAEVQAPDGPAERDAPGPVLLHQRRRQPHGLAAEQQHIARLVGAGRVRARAVRGIQ